MYTIPENVRQRLLLAHLTPARLSLFFEALVKGLNEQGLDDAGVNLEYTLAGEVYGEGDLLPSITIGVRKAVPPLKLELPG
jgi:hypothetical protein